MEVEAVAGLRKAQLVEEHLGERVEPVLPRVEDDLLDPRVPKGGGHGPGLDELGPIPHDREDLHLRKATDTGSGLGPMPAKPERTTIGSK